MSDEFRMRQIKQPHSGRCPMTDAGWADETVAAAQRRYPNANTLNIAAYVATKEHKRAVRVVKRQLDLYQRQREVEKDEHMRDLLAGSIFACVDLLESLQRGRE